MDATRFYPIRAWNGDLLANIKAEDEAAAYRIFYALEERRSLKGSPIPDGRKLLQTPGAQLN